jgi:G3E family GTPase
MAPAVSRLFPAEERAKLPVSVITGFLGSGKTTLLNRLLGEAAMAGSAVIINEFGEVPLDGALIGAKAGEVVTLANGCLCCVVGDDFEVAMGNLYRSVENVGGEDIRRILIETSGLADPAPIIGTLLNSPMMSTWTALDSVITTVDALHALTQLREHPEAATQVAFADRLVVTKADMVSPETLAEVRREIERHNRHGRLIVSRDGDVSPAELFDVQSKDGKANAEHLAEVMQRISTHGHHHSGHGGDHHHTPDVESFAIVARHPLDWSRFNRWLRGVRLAHADNLLRMKGILDLAGEDKPVVVHAVRHVFHPPSALESWSGMDRASRLVFIVRGGGLRKLIEQSFAADVVNNKETAS